MKIGASCHGKGASKAYKYLKNIPNTGIATIPENVFAPLNEFTPYSDIFVEKIS